MKIPFSFVLILVTSLASAQQFMTRSGNVHFFSATPIENIEADNNQMTGLLDESDGGFAFQVQMRAFHFEKALMEEHFNENYVESEMYPKATFQGQINNWSMDMKDGKTHEVVATGTFEIHGVKDTRDISGSIMWNGSSWDIHAAFPVELAKHNIEVPAAVMHNIASVIDVDVKASLDPR